MRHRTNFAVSPYFPSLAGVSPLRYGPGPWSDHIPFAADLISVLRPKTFVELGVYKGESYFAFCQASAECHTQTVCYGVDTWTGDKHSGRLAERDFESVQRHNADFYAASSYLLRTTFDEALGQFQDNSIDLLHIDGLHTYEAVRHDFDAWYPKVKVGGVIIMHDVAARHGDFGVWKLWAELEPRARSFSFLHSWGLGVWQKPGGEAHDSLDEFFPRTEETLGAMRAYYQLAARELRARKSLPEKNSGGSSATSSPRTVRRTAQALLYFPLPDGGHSADSVETISLETGRWVKIRVGLPELGACGSLRFDPLEEVGLADLAGLRLWSSVGELLWECRGSGQLNNLTVAGTACRIDHGLFFRMLSYGNDPCILLPPLPQIDEAGVHELEITLRVLTEWEDLRPHILKWAEAANSQGLGSFTGGDLARIERELDLARSNQLLTRAELHCVSHELKETRQALTASHEELSTACRSPLVTQSHATQLRDLESQYKIELGRRRSMGRSLSWKLTLPLRAALRFLKSGSFGKRR